MDRPSLQEQLDACRSLADATSDPELRELSAALRSDPQLPSRLENQLALDHRILEQLDDVTPPEDLKASLIAAFRKGALRNAQDSQRLAPVVTKSLQGANQEASADPQSVPARRDLVTRRRYGARVLGLTVLASVAILFVVFLNRSPGPNLVTLSPTAFAANAIKLCRSDLSPWKAMDAVEKPKHDWNFAQLPLIAGAAPVRWKETNSDFAGLCSIYQFETQGGEGGYLLMSNAAWEEGKLPSSISRNPIHDSGGWTAGVWRRNGVAYALVVSGDAAAYRAVVQPASIALWLPTEWSP